MVMTLIVHYFFKSLVCIILLYFRCDWGILSSFLCDYWVFFRVVHSAIPIVAIFGFLSLSFTLSKTSWCVYPIFLFCSVPFDIIKTFRKEKRSHLKYFNAFCDLEYCNIHRCTCFHFGQVWKKRLLMMTINIIIIIIILVLFKCVCALHAIIIILLHVIF